MKYFWPIAGTIVVVFLLHYWGAFGGATGEALDVVLGPPHSSHYVADYRGGSRAISTDISCGTPTLLSNGEYRLGGTDYKMSPRQGANDLLCGDGHTGYWKRG